MKLFSIFAFTLLLWTGCSSGKLSPEEQDKYVRQGQDITKEVGMIMTSALTKSLNDGGVARAAQYCSYIAIPLVDTLAVRHGVQIRRTSTKLRNAKNDTPTERELAVLEQYARQKEAGKELQPLVEAIDPNTVAYYQPIFVQPMCLNCHGVEGETLTEDNYTIIKYMYPKDEATGYKIDDLRGIWSLTMPRESTE
ncbi:MAG: DUF3365 domain-containing protein [Lewinellaceae bacterium]|nr:DUF3365 domain-containing protein [Lewinellaceae bacterium]